MIDSQQCIIKTDNSALYVYNVTDITIIPNCISEIDDKLILNPPIIVYGKPAIQHRAIGFFSDFSIGYKYSNQLAKSQPLSENLKQLLESINLEFNTDFNGILINKYLNGEDYIGAHSDDEKNLSEKGVIAISYGAIRNFRIRDKKTKKIIENVPTEPNQIIHMCGNFQKEFTHEIPIQKKIRDIRWSFTFRKHLI
jgi:alkylated DNA repair dioxygenase AlkB